MSSTIPHPPREQLCNRLTVTVIAGPVREGETRGRRRRKRRRRRRIDPGALKRGLDPGALKKGLDPGALKN
jgi:hypothetical protein